MLSMCRGDKGWSKGQLKYRSFVFDRQIAGKYNAAMIPEMGHQFYHPSRFYCYNRHA